MNPAKLGVLLYGGLCYLLFLATFTYTIGFVTGLVVPKHLDSVSGELPGTTQALLVNIGLLSLFAVQHTIMARFWFKRWLTRFTPAATERSTFVLTTCAILIALFLFWQPLPTVIWEVDAPILRGALHALALVGFGGVVFVTFLIDHFGFFGMRQTLGDYTGRPARRPSFQVHSLYRISRHPLYLGLFLGFWSAPTMTAGHLLFASLCTAYIFVGVRFEEHNLVVEHGDAYRAYKLRVPAILPLPGRSSAPVLPEAPGGPGA